MAEGDLPYIEVPFDPEGDKWALVIQPYGAPSQQAFQVTGKREDIVLKACQAISTEDPLALEDAKGNISTVVPLPRNVYVRVIEWDDFAEQMKKSQAAAALARFKAQGGVT